MARFKLTNGLFRWTKATAAQINDIFDEFKDWVDTSLSTDSLMPISVDTHHHKEPLTFLISEHLRHIEGVAVGSPLAEVDYVHSATGTHKIVIFAWTWYRNRNGNAGGTSTGTAETNRICWFDSNAGTWNLADFVGRHTAGVFSLTHDDVKWGADHQFTNPLPGIGYAIPNLLFEYGGSPCMMAMLVKDSAQSDWPPAGPATITKYGVFGQDSAGVGTRDGQAQIWLFAEDNKK